MGAILVLLFVLKVILDIVGLFRSNYEIDGLYCAVMLAAGIIGMFDGDPLLACATIVVGLIYGGICARKYEKAREPPA